MSNGTISANNLMERLVSAKKIMNKVDSGDYERGTVNTEVLYNDPEDLAKQMIQEGAPMPQPRMVQPVQQGTNLERINQSKLPDAIKRAMIEKPIDIPDISLNETLDMNIIQGAKRLMEKENLIENKKQAPKPFSQQNQPQRERVQQQQVITESYPISSSNLVQELTPIIENIVRKTLDEIFDRKLNQILTAQQMMSVNENLVLKVGDSIFSGKINNVKKAK